MTDLDKARAKLNEIKADLEARHARIASHHHGLAERDAEAREAEKANDEVIGALDVNVQQELAAVHHALARLQGGEYTACERCGKTIAAERLEALPFTTLCIGCAEAASAAGE